MYDLDSLRSTVRELESKLSAQRRENRELEDKIRQMRYEIDRVLNAVNAASNNLIDTENNINGTMNNSARVFDYANNRTLETIALQEEIRSLYSGFSRIETANKRIRELNNKLYYDYAGYRTIRKIMLAFIDNLDLSIVREELIYKSIEKEYLQSPDYWLVCALLAVMHWRNDNEFEAKTALSRALELDEKQTVMFFFCLNILFDRKEVALKWFEYYKSMNYTGEEAQLFYVMLCCFNLKNGEKATFEKTIEDFIRKEYAESAAKYSEAKIVSSICNEYNKKTVEGSRSFDLMRSYVVEYNALIAPYLSARNNAAILDYIEDFHDLENARPNKTVVGFLEAVIEKPAKEELGVRKEIEYNEEIIQCVGDVGKAQENIKAKEKHDANELNLCAETQGWLFGDKIVSQSDVADSNMFQLNKKHFATAAKAYTQNYRSKVTPVRTVSIKDFSQKLDLTKKEEGKQAIKRHYEEKERQQLAQITNSAVVLTLTFGILFCIAAVVALVFSFIKPELANLFYVLAGLGAVVGIICIIVSSVKKGANAKKRRSVSEYNQALADDVCAIFSNVCDEYAVYMKEYKEYDSISEDILLAINR